jgi:hypothetical protein
MLSYRGSGIQKVSRLPGQSSELENENRSRIVKLEEQVKVGITGNGTPSRLRAAEIAIDQLTQFKYRILGIMAAICAIGAFIGWFFPKK